VRTPNHRFLRYLVNTFGKLPNDPFYEDINPYLRVWLYEGWCHDLELEAEKLRNHAILTGSFSNPEAAQKMIKEPTYQSTDIEETSRWVREKILESENKGKKRKKRKVVK
jgi:hypothetical protein